MNVSCVLQVKRVDEDWDSVRSDLQRIRELLMQRKGALVNLTADDHTLTAVRPHVDAFLGTLPESSASTQQWANLMQPQNEAITVPTQVQLFAK